MIYFSFQVNSMIAAKDSVIEHLKSENDRLRKEVELEARRANNAVDRLLSESKIGGITPDVKREASIRADDIIKSVHAAARVGQAVEIKEETNG